MNDTLHIPERLEDESFEDYKIRRAYSNRVAKCGRTRDGKWIISTGWVMLRQTKRNKK